MIAWICVTLLGMLFAVACFNFLTALRLESAQDSSHEPLRRLSVLIPARNEAQNLKSLLPALLSSQVAPHEIIVLDDNSDDGTSEIATQILKEGSIPFRVLKGATWSPTLGLTGKNHACAQLAHEAVGDIFLFCDADVIPSKNAVGRTLSLLSRFNCAGLSALPRQVTSGERERLALPWIMQIPLITLLPLSLGWRTRFSSLQMANGQWLAVDRQRYEEVGGHRTLGRDLVDDMALARRLTDRHRGGLIPVLSASDLSVRMYSSWDQMRQGFAKNIVQMYGGTRPMFSACLVAWIALFCFPLWAVFLNPIAALAGAILILAIRWLNCVAFHGSLSDLPSHFRSLFWLANISINTLRVRGSAQVRWKGRNV